MISFDASRNASNFFRHPHDIFVAVPYGPNDEMTFVLGRVSKYNFLGRLIVWVRDWLSNWTRSKAAEQVFLLSLVSIEQAIRENSNSTKALVLGSYCVTPPYDYNILTNKFAGRVLSQHWNDPTIRVIAGRIIALSEATIASLPKPTRDSLFNCISV